MADTHTPDPFDKFALPPEERGKPVVVVRPLRPRPAAPRHIRRPQRD
jgi:hypothetical protein